MVSFVEVNEKFKEICNYYFNSENECQFCPLVDNCYDPPANPKKTEEIIMNWQPNIYPTILELIRYIAEYLPTREDNKRWYDIPLSELVHNRIPEEIAKKFDIMPINACGLNKYIDNNEMESEWR